MKCETLSTFWQGELLLYFSKLIKKEKIKKAKEQLDTLPTAGPDGIPVPDTSGTFFKYPTRDGRGGFFSTGWGGAGQCQKSTGGAGRARAGKSLNLRMGNIMRISAD